MNPQVSIIVPVYKAEQYLERCLDSILAQTFSDWELILVDDGSPDRSREICDRYAENDVRIRVFHKENGGVASAREVGMQNAIGTYSIHVDPDDWIDDNTLQILYNKAINDNSDIVVYDFLIEYQNRKERSIQEPVELKDDIYLYQLLSQERHGSLCNKLIRTQLYRDLDLHFPSDMICWEDLYICCRILSAGCRISYVQSPFYHYDIFSNHNSMVRKTEIRGLNSQIKFCQLVEEHLPTNQHYLLNESKGLCKLTAFRCNLMDDNNIRNLFPEINEWYIKKYGRDYEKSNYWGLTVVLRGKSIRTASYMMKCAELYCKIKRNLKKIRYE